MPWGFKFGLASFNIFVNYLEKDKGLVLIMFSRVIELDRRGKKWHNKIRTPRGLQLAERIGQNS